MNNFLVGGYVLQVVPALIGAFAGAPLLARELETGTFRYAWTQGFGRWRWTLAKLVPLAVVVAAAAAAISVLFSWYYQPYFATGNQALSLSEAPPLAAGLFGLRGVAFAAWTLAAFAIGALAGMLIRRVVPAIVATLAAYTGLALVAGELPAPALPDAAAHQQPERARFRACPESVVDPWRQIRVRLRPPPNDLLMRLCPNAPAGVLGKPLRQTFFQCLAQHGYRTWTSYQPTSRFWPFQWIECGWLLALSVLLIVVTVWLVRRRVA